MSKLRWVGALAFLGIVSASVTGALLKPAAPGVQMTSAANAYLKTLDEAQLKVSQMPYETPQRVDWHFIPKSERKGLQIKHMTEPQRKAAHDLLRASLSAAGYKKATQIMELESLLFELEKGRSGGPVRDAERYYFTVFGKPADAGRWGLSMEGHHLSLNFVVDDGQMISSTPTFFAANPAEVKAAVPGSDIEKGTRVLAKEERLAFRLLRSLDDIQQAKAVIAKQAPREIRAAGAPQPPADEQVGLSLSEMNEDQRQVLMNLVQAYANNVPKSEAAARLQKIERAGWDNVRFAWAGATKPGVGHYYRIQGESFLVEFVNTQPDAAGNPANHIHCVWRDMAGDFALPVK